MLENVLSSKLHESNINETISAISIKRTAVNPHEYVKAVGKILFENPDLQSLPVIYNDIPVGIIYRVKFMEIFLNPYGHDLYDNKPIQNFMAAEPLIVEYDLPIQQASEYIAQNLQVSALHEFIITKNGKYHGMGTVLDLLGKMTELQLNQLKEENIRLSTEIDVTHRLQQMLLPKETELNEIEGLEISGFMKPAYEIGGDYYDVLQHNGRIILSIGDVTGHGLESGVLTLMTQAAVRTLLENNETNLIRFINSLNGMVYKNVQERMDIDINITLSLLEYQQEEKGGCLRITGRHEEIIVVQNGKLKRIDTGKLGFMVGFIKDISNCVNEIEIFLKPGDVMVLYTDGITEAENTKREEYGIKRFCDVVKQHWQESAKQIKQAVIDDVQQYISTQKIGDDMTLLVLKQK